MTNTNHKDDKIDIFISYRRQGGATVAALLYRELEARGFQVFMDTVKLKTGDYEKAILKYINSAENFILLVSDGVFKSENVVWEVETALSLEGKRIIPIFINNNNIFENTPEKIKAIEKQNGVVLNHLNPNNSINYLIEQITSRADNLVDRITQVFDIDSVRSILDECKEIDEEIENEILSFVKQRIKNRVKIISKKKSKKFFETLFSIIYYTHAKKIAKELGFDYKRIEKKGV
ncbi:toll/interleukin-1 receptor domain-containing protein [Alishewanella longhuensis]